MRKRLLILFCAVDHLILAILTLGNCVRGQTLSASAWKQEQDGKLQGKIFRPLIDFVMRPIEPDHCARCWYDEHYLRKGTQP